MEPTLTIIDRKLKEAGMSQVEIDHLMARFLEEEAFNYVETMNEMQELIERKAKENITLH